MREEQRSPQEVDRILASRRVATRHRAIYASELVDALALRDCGGLVRAGIVPYPTADEVAAPLTALPELGPAWTGPNPPDPRSRARPARRARRPRCDH